MWVKAVFDLLPMFLHFGRIQFFTVKTVVYELGEAPQTVLFRTLALKGFFIS